MKRVFDIVFSALLILLLAPILFITAALVALKLGRPVIFSQVRPGLHGKPFKMFKFRSMTDGKDEHGELLSDEQRLTPFGAKLRATSLDELPELFNILKGDMSFVGPRPLLMQYLPLYNERQSKRHNVRPGLTGWAQINGRNDMSWQDKFEHDVWYVENQSLALDIKIMYQTLGKVIKSEGVVAEGQATTKFFEGNDK
ncbi:MULTISPECIES: sugar transferase [Pseudoalteromonas]|uniref:Sugar transferase n=1 Tax=Pseudoalteromonas ruthenica TaxID=151081 RepID=A0A0F4PLB4_9GAMM|nr:MULTISPECIES: sugar transferase [Pseudoalteromonas]KJY95006.1 sugar transferase [Pseudoalteromonas ruthenica]KJY98687.1 sugar transferase [Pseudoalteromonas ruthenica]TMO93759.1 sugar transferase [Pseudoalteromonas ruthenica]TMP21973.1 sugar transferase [Pseudoalteromonas ruthenica]